MSVKKSATAVASIATQETDEALAPVFVELELARIKRYILVGDSKTYETGVIYVFTPEKAKQMLMLSDDSGLPVFITPRPVKKPVRPPVRTAEGDNRAREMVDDPVRALAPTSTSRTPSKAIVIEDDDPDLARRLSDLDGGDDSVEV